MPEVDGLKQLNDQQQVEIQTQRQRHQQIQELYQAQDSQINTLTLKLKEISDRQEHSLSSQQTSIREQLVSELTKCRAELVTTAAQLETASARMAQLDNDLLASSIALRAQQGSNSAYEFHLKLLLVGHTLSFHALSLTCVRWYVVVAERFETEGALWRRKVADAENLRATARLQCDEVTALSVRFIDSPFQLHRLLVVIREMMKSWPGSRNSRSCREVLTGS